MITIDYKDRRPIYEQIVAEIEDLAAKGTMGENAQLPSVRQLAMELSINPNTIQKAYSLLEKSGVIYTVKGKGNFIAENAEGLRKEKLAAIHNELYELVKQAMQLGETPQQIRQWLAEMTDEGGNKA